MLSILSTFLISYLILFVVCYILVEYGQSYFYDEVTSGRAGKVALGSLLLAAMLTWTRSSFETMFTNDIGLTVLQAILWTGVFILIFRFHPWHGFGLAIATMLVITGLITIVVDSLLAPKTAARIDTSISNKPVRRSNPVITPTPAPAPAPAPAKK